MHQDASVANQKKGEKRGAYRIRIQNIEFTKRGKIDKDVPQKEWKEGG